MAPTPINRAAAVRTRRSSGVLRAITHTDSQATQMRLSFLMLISEREMRRDDIALRGSYITVTEPQ